ncbi:hypothetical protein ACFO8N_16295 [Sneathiella chungangensis]|nr:hypothetical protein [Sneathiella chungangensis]
MKDQRLFIRVAALLVPLFLLFALPLRAELRKARRGHSFALR